MTPEETAELQNLIAARLHDAGQDIPGDVQAVIGITAIDGKIVVGMVVDGDANVRRLAAVLAEISRSLPVQIAIADIEADANN